MKCTGGGESVGREFTAMGFILQEADVLNEALGVGEGSRCWLCGSKYI